MMFWTILYILISTLALLSAKHVYFTLDFTYRCGSPDGVRTCHVVKTNGQFPGPTIEATIGDTLHITVRNNVPDAPTTVHWHGIVQNGSPFQDGLKVTQCEIPTDYSMKYKFKVEQSGTYWWHSHVSYQRAEGMFGFLIVRNNPEVYREDYDDEILISLAEWYHEGGRLNQDWVLSPASQLNSPTPNSLLINGHGVFPCNSTKRRCNPKKQRVPVFYVEHGKRYRIRVLNASAFLSFLFSITNHKLTVIETDGINTVKKEFDQVPIATAQRYSFIVQINCEHDSWIMAEHNLEEFIHTVPNINTMPEALPKMVKAKLHCVTAKAKHPLTNWIQASKAVFYKPSISDSVETGFNEMLLQPYDRVLAPATFDREFMLLVIAITDSKGVRRPTFNMRQFHEGSPPLLVLAVKGQSLPASVNPQTIYSGEVIQVVINNHGAEPHQFHLHGHVFWVMGFGAKNADVYNASRDQLLLNGVKRDTVVVETKSWVVIRFVADNPGVWFFHCHNLWHLELGLALVFNEAPDIIPKKFTIPAETRRICRANNIKI